MAGGGTVIGSGIVPDPTGERGGDGATWEEGMGVGIGVTGGVGSALGSRAGTKAPSSVDRGAGFSRGVLSAGGRAGEADC